MKKILLALILLSASTFAQTGFIRNTTIPISDSAALELGWAGGLNFPVFSEINLNNDNRPDLYVFDRSNNRSLTFINNGGPGIHCWEYAPQYESSFPTMRGWAFLYDYNCDGKQDILTVSSSNSGITLYRNDGQGSTLTFTLVDSVINYDYGGPTLSNVLASGNLVPNFDDIDGDGDMDILGLEFQCAGGFAYYKNNSMEDYGVCDSLDDYVLVTNLWGGFTLRSGLYSNVAVGSWNVTCFQGPGGGGSYEIAVRDDTYATIHTIDIDGDGDKDAIIGDSQANNSLLVINGGTNTNAHMVPPQDTLFPSYNVPVNLHSFTMHAYVDADNDGIKDLLVSESEYENNRGILFYKNVGTNNVPVFNYQMNDFFQKQMIDIGESATPVLFDYNSDGLKDLIIGNKLKTTGPASSKTGLTLYKNIGTASSPAFQFVTDDYAGLQSQALSGQLFPAFGDLDGDNDMDMIVGLDDGRFNYYRNTAGPGVPAAFAAPVFFYMSIDVGQAATPQLFDLDRDGLLDLVTGCKNGLIKYFKNLGSTSIPFFSTAATKDTLGNFVVQTTGYPDGYSVPFLFEQNGDYRLLVSCMKGDIYLYGNIDGNVTGSYTMLDTVFTKTGGNRYGYNISVSGGDINNDTLTDMLVGYYGGGVQFFYQENPTSSASNLSKEDIVSLYPNPACDYIILKSPFSYNKQEYKLFDISGRLLATESIKGNYSIINLTNIASGIYIVRILAGETVIEKKLIVQK